jgi:3-hydroxyisobutyrate dehydrogenase-like beta-hydroxyacid dehydrogenase
MRVSIVGLGIVGMALSQRLLRAGYEVAGWHQDPAAVYRALSPGPSSEPRNSPCT